MVRWDLPPDPDQNRDQTIPAGTVFPMPDIHSVLRMNLAASLHFLRVRARGDALRRAAMRRAAMRRAALRWRAPLGHLWMHFSQRLLLAQRPLRCIASFLAPLLLFRSPRSSI